MLLCDTTKEKPSKQLHPAVIRNRIWSPFASSSSSFFSVCSFPDLRPNTGCRTRSAPGWGVWSSALHGVLLLMLTVHRIALHYYTFVHMQLQLIRCHLGASQSHLSLHGAITSSLPPLFSQPELLLRRLWFKKNPRDGAVCSLKIDTICQFHLSLLASLGLEMPFVST